MHRASKLFAVAFLCCCILVSPVLVRSVGEKSFDQLFLEWVQNLGVLLKPLSTLPGEIALLRSAPPTRLPVPVLGVSAGKLANSWGNPRSGKRKHEGIDIFAARNTPVISTTRGLIVSRGTNKLGGLVVHVLGPGGQVHYYAHLESYGQYKTWDWVEPGDVIGHVGNSGNARGTPTHLHYGIYASGGALNPYPLLSNRVTLNG